MITNDFGEKKMKFGKYRGTKLKNIQDDDYFKWLIKENIPRGRLLTYIKRKLNLPKEKYKVIIEDAATGDGEYTVLAHDESEAIRNAKKQGKVQGTQSYHGTSYSVMKL